jgi:hypothetical protein
MKSSRLVFVAALFLTLCSVKTNGQETNQRATPPGKGEETPVRLPDYVVQVRRPEGCLVAPISPKAKMGYVLYTLPRPSKIPPDSAGNARPSKVFVWAKQNGAQWDVRVTIGTGEFYDAGDTKVGEFKLGLNQLVSVPDVSRFGLGPIRVGVMKIVRQEAGKPWFRNLTQSVSLESMETGELPDPFKLVLKNNSGSDLIAIQYNTFARDQFLALKWLGNGLLNPLIKAGESYTLKVNSEDDTCGDEDGGYRPNQSNRIEFVSAVFADGSYEGQVALPALIKGSALGNYRNLEGTLEYIRYATDAIELSQQLKALHENMNEDVDPYLFEILRNMAPTITDYAALNGFIRSGMHEIKVSVGRDAQYLQMVGERGSPELKKKWVDQIKNKYERWFIAARNITSQ